MKIDCSITENYLKEKARMIEHTEDSMCTAICDDCPLCSDNNGTNASCDEFDMLYPNKAIEIVQKWSDEHPQMTMLDKFKEQHPKGMCSGKGTPIMCPYHLGYEKSKNEECRNYKGNCVKCWNRPYTEDNE